MNLSCTSRHIYNIKNSISSKPAISSLLVFLPLNETDKESALKTCSKAQSASFSGGHEQYMHSEQLQLLAHTQLSNDSEVPYSVWQLDSSS